MIKEYKEPLEVENQYLEQAGVIIEPITKHLDERGVLFELFRDDEGSLNPVMGYMSYTKPNVARGPHCHVHQSDKFYFFDGDYELHLWIPLDQKHYHYTSRVGEKNPISVIVPPGVVHGYCNVGAKLAFVLNFPDKLYKGENKLEPVDEIRYENDPNALFKMPDYSTRLSAGDFVS